MAKKLQHNRDNLYFIVHSMGCQTATMWSISGIHKVSAYADIIISGESQAIFEDEGLRTPYKGSSWVIWLVQRQEEEMSWVGGWWQNVNIDWNIPSFDGALATTEMIKIVHHNIVRTPMNRTGAHPGSAGLCSEHRSVDGPAQSSWQAWMKVAILFIAPEHSANDCRMWQKATPSLRWYCLCIKLYASCL